MIENGKLVTVLYLCKRDSHCRGKCYSECHLTSEIEHAKNINEMMSSLKNLSDDQKVIVKFLIDMNNDQIRRVSNK